jgi:hypothetical protein
MMYKPVKKSRIVKETIFFAIMAIFIAVLYFM